MKLTSIAGVFAVVLAVTAAFAFKPKHSEVKSQKPLLTEVWIKYDCALGTAQNPVPARDVNNQLIEIPAGQAPIICDGLSEVVCVAKLRVTEATGPQQPLIFNSTTGKYEFNPAYTNPQTAFTDAFYCEQ